MKRTSLYLAFFLSLMLILGCYCPPIKDTTQTHADSDSQQRLNQLPEEDNPSQNHPLNFKTENAGVVMTCQCDGYIYGRCCLLENTNAFPARIREISLVQWFGEATEDMYTLEPGQQRQGLLLHHSFYIYSLDGINIGFLK